MCIREASLSDLPRIGELGSRSLQDGPYAGIIKDNPEQAQIFASWLIKSERGRILLAEEENRVIGLLGFMGAQHHFSGQPYATELMWYVEPEYRKKYPFTTISLFRAAERIAREMGAESMVFTAPNREIGDLYEKCGYKQMEIAYRKVF